MMKLVVLSCMLAAAAASAIGAIGYASPLAYTTSLAYASPLFQPYNYRGPLSLARGQPANILAADGRPLDTIDVNLDRSAHYTAKALEGSGLHLLKKRSAALVAPYSNIALGYSASLLPATRLTYAAPLVANYAHYTYPGAHIAHALY